MGINVKGVTKRYQGRTVVNDVSFSIEKNRCTALIGPNGAGKTTLLKVLAGLIVPEKGEISFHNHHHWKKEIGYLPQNPAFFNEMTAKELLMMLGKVSGLKRSELHVRTKEVLEAVNLQDSANRKIGGFSGGMKQRLGLAQAILHKPSILLLDEPVSALDPIGRRDVIQILSKLKESATIIYSTHVLHDAEEISDDVLLLKDGAIITHDTVAHLLSQTGQHFTLKINGPIEEKLSSCKWISHCEVMGNQASFHLRDKATKEQFLQWCLQHNLDIISFQQGTQTLERVFLEVVKK